MIYIGASGYKFKDWQSVFYPKNMQQNKWLAHYSKYFNYIETELLTDVKSISLNLSDLAEQSENKLKIGIKLNKEITHLNINKSNISDNINIAKIVSKNLAEISNQIWFGPILMEFPFSFRYSQSNFEKVKILSACFIDLKKCLEFQHDSWMSPDIIEFASQNKISLCLRDVPKFQNMIGSNNYLITSNVSYIRMHGRNETNWWQPTYPEDQTDYSYSHKELSAWFNNINIKILNSVNDVYIIFNNPKNGYAVENALYMMKKFRLKPALPEQPELPFF
ncbi:DUF72 domain-containing protein [Candidatus Dependentiae bacterium]|nr:DUF72 domain-containing protein [Candidatus Dependentiae bacterium]